MTHNKYLIVLFLGDNDLISAKSAACPNVVFKSSIGFSSIKFLDWAPTSISHFFRPSVFPFVGVRPAIRLSVCLSFCLSVCLSVCPSVVHHISGTLHHVTILIGKHVWNDDTSSCCCCCCFFSSFQNFGF